ncbi:MAG TPA: glycosyltransferase 87 family protein, partial [Actinomycetota bacterium]
LAVAFATAATLAYLNRRDVWSGILLGLGAAAKLYPVLVVVPFVAGRFKDKEPDRGIHLAWAGAGAWLAVNLPFAVAAPKSWWEFFRFNLQRPADWDSLWFIGHHRLTGDLYSQQSGAIGVASTVLFAVACVVVWRLRRRVSPDFARWTFGFPILVLFLITNKVYSPQYGLWLLPWFALALPDLRLFALFEASDVAVFLTRFSWFGRYSGIGGLPIGAFELAVVIRFLVLVVCVVAWIRRPEPAPVVHAPSSETLADAAT